MGTTHTVIRKFGSNERSHSESHGSKDAGNLGNEHFNAKLEYDAPAKPLSASKLLVINIICPELDD